MELNLTTEQATLLWCQGIRARRIAKQGIAEQNICKITEGFAWFDNLLVQVTKALPPEMQAIGATLTGNETNKP